MKRICRRSLLPLLLVVVPMSCTLWAREPGAGVASGTTPSAENALAAGDFEQACLGWIEQIRENPNRPDLAALLAKLELSFPYLTRPEEVTRELATLENLAIAQPSSRLLFFATLERWLRHGAHRDVADTIAAKSGAATHWMRLGPLGTSQGSSHRRIFPVELGPWPRDPALEGATLPEVSFDRKTHLWVPQPSFSASGGTDLFAYVLSTYGAMYGCSQGYCSEAFTGTIGLSGTALIKVWLNGRLVLDADRLAAEQANLRLIRADFTQGWNALLVKVTSGHPSSFQLYVTDAAGRLSNGWRWEEGPIAHAVASLEGAEAPLEGIGPAFEEITMVPREPGGRAESVEGEILGSYFLGLEDSALDAAQEVFSRRPERREEGIPAAAAAYWMALMLEEARSLPEGYRRNRAKQFFDRALVAHDRFLPARLGQARYLARDQKTEEALWAIEESLKIRGDFAAALAYGARICGSFGWEEEARRFAGRLRNEFPQASALLEIEAEQAARQGLHLQEAASLKQLVERAPEHTFKLIQVLAQMGQHEGAWAWVEKSRQWPEGSLRRLAMEGMLLESQGKYQECAARVQKQEEFYRESSWVPLKVGELLLVAGDREGAEAAFERALGKQPGNHKVRRQLERLRGKRSRYWEPFQEDIQKLIRESPGQTAYPRASALYLLDQMVVEVYEDGSYSEYVHELIQLFNEQAIEQYGTVEIQGELLEARTHRPDGTILEPIALGEEKSFTMPGLEPDAVIEYAYRRDRPAPVGHRFTFPGSFYFQDLQFDAPFFLSQFIIVAPEDLDLRYVLRNWDRKPVVEVRELPEDSGRRRKITRWEAKRMGRIEPEKGMPDRAELLPHVYIGSEQSWEEIAWELEDFFAGRTIPSASIRRKVRELMEGKSSAREKIESIFRFVNDWVRTDRSAQNAVETWLLRSGRRLYLLGAMLEAAGIHFSFAMVRANPLAEPEPPYELPQDYYFYPGEAATFLRMETGPEVIWIQPPLRHQRLGEVEERYQGGMALVLAKSGGYFERIPLSSPSVHEDLLELELSLDADGGFEGRLQALFRGPEDARTKEEWSLLDRVKQRTALERWIHQMFPGAVVRTLEMPGLSDFGEPLKIVVELETKRFAKNRDPSTGSGDLRCPIGLAPVSLVGRFGGEMRRKTPMVLPSAVRTRDHVLLGLPKGFVAKVIPESVTMAGPFGAYALGLRTEGDNVVVERRLSLPAQRILPEAFPDFLRFCQQIDRAEQGKILLRRVN